MNNNETWPEDQADWPQTASIVQGGVVSQPARCDNCNKVVTEDNSKALFCTGEINGVQRHIIRLCSECEPTNKHRGAA